MSGFFGLGQGGDADDRPAVELTPDEKAADERQKRQRLIAARLIVAGVGLTFLIVGFVEFITKTN